MFAVSPQSPSFILIRFLHDQIFRIKYFYIIISWTWVDQNFSSLFLNELIDLACITEFGRLFHGSDTLRGMHFFLNLFLLFG